MQNYVPILVIMCSAQFHHVFGKCRPSSYSVNGYHLYGHVMSTRTVSSLSECVTMCITELHCKSLNFLSIDKSCDLNDEDRRAHPKDYGPREGYIYMDMFTTFEKSCAEIQQVWPEARSRYYWIKIGSREAQVYCDMTSYGGGWTLVATISSKENSHLHSTEVNCLDSKLCVPFTDKNISARKLRDNDIHKVLHFEGTFRVDVLGELFHHTIFYQIPSGPQNFDSSCVGTSCPRMIISHSFPYRWETNSCTSVDRGYGIVGCHRVFDGHDDGECGIIWHSSQYHRRRALYGYPLCHKNSHGLFLNKAGMLFVK